MCVTTLEPTRLVHALLLWSLHALLLLSLPGSFCLFGDGYDSVLLINFASIFLGIEIDMKALLRIKATIREDNRMIKH